MLMCLIAEEKKSRSGGIGAIIYNRVITGLYGPEMDTGKFPVDWGWGGAGLTASGSKKALSEMTQDSRQCGTASEPVFGYE